MYVYAHNSPNKYISITGAGGNDAIYAIVLSVWYEHALHALHACIFFFLFDINTIKDISSSKPDPDLNSNSNSSPNPNSDTLIFLARTNVERVWSTWETRYANHFS